MNSAPTGGHRCHSEVATRRPLLLDNRSVDPFTHAGGQDRNPREGSAMAKVLTRKGVHALKGPWHPVLRAYEQAIAVMKTRPATDATSLAYQAAVHGVGAPTTPPPDKFRS